MKSETDPAAAPSILHLARVLAVADPDGSEDLIGAAIALAKRHGARLDVLSCLEPPSDLTAIGRAAGLTPEEVLAHLRDERRREMTGALARVLTEGAPSPDVAVGKAFVEIIRHALLHDTDIVMKTAERLSGLQGRLFASTDQHLVRKCPCAVWLRTPDSRRVVRTIIAAVDVDEDNANEPGTLRDLNRRVVETALQIAPGQDTIVHVLHTWDAPGEGMIWAFSSGRDARVAAEGYVNDVEAARRRSLEALVRPFRKGMGENGPSLVGRLIRGSARSVIAEQARRLSADVVVMGTVARTGLSGVIIGNTAEDILNTIECSVVAVKPKNFLTPISPFTPDERAF